MFDPLINWLGSSMNHIQDWTNVRDSYSRALEQGPLSSTKSELKRPVAWHRIAAASTSSPAAAKSTTQQQAGWDAKAAAREAATAAAAAREANQ